MSRNNGSPTSQFQAVEELLTRWLKERRALLARFTEIAVALDSNADDHALRQRQDSLCELLVDYVSAGHFEVFHELINEAEAFADGSDDLARKIIPSIGDTTEVVLAYEEKYSGEDNHKDTLKRDLSALGEVLESRFVMEDRLIAGLHGRHRRLVGEQASPQA